MVTWKDALTGVWHGPDPVLAWARGAVCVFPQDHLDPIWVPERLVRKVQVQTEAEKDVTDMSGDPVPVPHPLNGESDGGAAVGDSVSLSQADASSP